MAPAYGREQEEYTMDHTMDHTIVDKVIKLLALADDSGATEGEKDTARNMAVKLMAKHQISIAQAHGAGETPNKRLFTKLEMETGLEQHEKATSLLLDVVARFNQVVLITGHNPTRYIFCGKEPDIESTLYMADILIRQRDDKNPRTRKADRQAWDESYARGVHTKLQELQQRTQQAVQERGLVPVDMRQSALQWYNENISQTNKGRATKARFDADGYNAGKSANIYRGVGNGQQSGAALQIGG